VLEAIRCVIRGYSYVSESLTRSVVCQSSAVPR